MAIDIEPSMIARLCDKYQIIVLAEMHFANLNV